MTSGFASRRIALFLLLATAVPVLVGAQAAPPAAERPRLALVLSGGGARGAAHIGALKVLEELHVVPDLLVGTSMGSIVGGLYAAGWSPDEIERLLPELDWGEVFSDTVPRREKPFRRKLDDSRMYIQGKLHFRGLKPYVPPGVLGGQRLELLLDSLEMVSSAPEEFDRLAIPFRAVAVDVGTGEAVVIDRGRLSRAMRASMAIPGMFPAVERDGKTLSDGGAVANLPIRIARDLGAGAVVAIDITSPLVREGQQFEDFWSVFSRMNSMLTAFNRVEDVRAVQPGDVYIRPELGDIGFLAFDRAAEAVGIGEAAARARADDLRRFAASESEWQEFLARRRSRERERILVEAVEVDNTSGLADGVVRANLPIEVGSVLDLGVLRESVMDLKALDAFGTIGTRLEPRPHGDTLVLTTPPPPYGRDSLQLGLYLEDDLEGHNTYSVYLRHLVQPINRLGGEIATTLEMGEPLRLATELYQPLEVSQRWYASPGAEASRELLPIWSDGVVLGRFQIEHWEAHLDIGRVLGRWGDVAFTLYRGNFDGSPESGFATIFPSFSEATGGTRVRFRVDTRDRAVLNRVGTRVEATWDHGSESLGAEASFRRWSLIADQAFSWGENTVAPYLEVGENLDAAGGLASIFALGGLGRLSGYGNFELLGGRLVLGRMMYYRRVARLDVSSLRLRAFVGVSAEVGNVFAIDAPVTWDALIASGGPFVAAITPIGPIYLGYGMAEGGRDRVYITLGQRF
jgi:NTE family protein